MFKFIGIAIVVIIAGALLFAATKPDSFRVERRIAVEAPAATIFALVNDFHAWPQWSPWEKIDPDLKRTYTGPATGESAAYAWEGNKNIGAGRMEILQSVPAEKILIQLDFLKPFEANDTAEFNFKPVGDTTEVTWAMYGPSPYLSKLMSLFFSMDKMVGGQFDTGLANLKAIVEKN